MGFHLFGSFIPYYGFCIAVGFIFSSLLAFFLSKHLSLNFDNCILISAYFIAFGFFGAKILFLIISQNSINWRLVFSSLKNFNALMASGFVFYGGVIGGMFAILFVKKVHKIELTPYLQIFSPCVALAHAFGRIGCSLAGCCYGKPVAGKFCFVYKESLVAPNGTPLFPVQGIEATFLFLFSLVFTVLILKKVKINIFALYIFSYSTLRFVLEFFRGDTERGFVGIFSTSQIISMIFILGIGIEKKLQFFRKTY